MEKIRLGVQLYTFRHKMHDSDSVKKVFEFIKKSGGESVQLSGMPKDVSPKTLQQIAMETELPITTTHTPFDRLRDDLDAVIDEHLLYNSKTVGISNLPGNVYSVKTVDGVCAFADFMNKTAEKLKKAGLNLHYHNHAFEFKKIDGKYVYDILLENFDPEINFSLDIYWLKIAKQDPSALIERLGKRVEILHMKDYKKFLFIPKMVTPGDGILDYPSLLRQSQKYGTTDAFIELDITPDPYKAVEKGMKYLIENYK